MILAFGDVHFVAHNQYSTPTEDGYTTLLKMQVDALAWVSQEIEDRKPQTVVFLGDLFHTTGTVDVRALNTAYAGMALVALACEQVGADFHVLLGNHDLTGDVDALPWVDGVVRQPTLACANAGSILLLPFGSKIDDDHMGALLPVGHPDPPLVFSHVPIKGMHIVGPIFETHGFDVENRDLVIISGHYHTAGMFKVGKSTIYRPGSLVARNYNDRLGDFPRGMLAIREYPLSPKESSQGVDWIPNPRTEEFITMQGSLEGISQGLDTVPSPERTRLRVYVEGDSPDDTHMVLGEQLEGYLSQSTYYVAEKTDQAVQVDLVDPVDLVAEYVKRNHPAWIEEPIGEKDPLIKLGLDLLSQADPAGKLSRDLVINSVDITNFLSIESHKLEFGEQGLTLVSGENGQGKSALFEALVWCLYGNTPRGTSHDAVIRRGASDGTKVTVDLTVGETHASIVRHRGHSEGKNTLQIAVEGEIVSFGQLRETQEQVDNIIGIDQWSFTSLVALSMSATEYFSSSTEAVRRGILNRVVGTDVYDQARETTKARLAEANGNLESVGQTIAVAQERLTTLGEVQRRLTEERAGQIESLRAQILVDQRTSQGHVSEGTAIAAKLEEVNAAVQKAEVDYQGYDSLRVLRGKMVTFSQQSATLEGEKGTVAQRLNRMATEGSLCSICNQSITEEHMEQERETAANHVVNLEERQEGIAQHIENLNALAMDLDAAREVDRKRLNALFVEQAGIATQANIQRIHLDTLTTKINKDQSQLQQLETSPDSYEEEIEELTQRIGILAAQVVEHQEFATRYSFWAEGFGPKGLVNLALPRTLKVLGDRAQHYAIEYFGARPLMFLSFENEKVTVTADGSPYLNLSSGERARCDLSLQFALYDLLVAAVGSVNLLVVDEMDKGLDERGVDSLVEMLRSMPRCTYLVSHNPVVKGLVQGAEGRTLNVVKIDGRSVIT